MGVGGVEQVGRAELEWTGRAAWSWRGVRNLGRWEKGGATSGHGPWAGRPGASLALYKKGPTKGLWTIMSM